MKASLVKEIAELFGITLLSSESKAQPRAYSKEENAFLLSLGLDTKNERNLSLQLQELRQQHWSTIVDPVWVVQERDPIHVTLRLPCELKDDLLHWTVTEENYAEHKGSVPVTDLPVQQEKKIDGKSFIAVTLRLSLSLPCGYHNLSITFDRAADKIENKVSCKIIVTPDKCYLPPELQQGKQVWGLSCNLDMVRSKSDWGIGDLSDVKSILSWGAENGAATLMINALNPVLPTQEDFQGQRQWASQRFLSPVYLDPKAIIDFTENIEVQDLVQELTFQMRLSELRDQVVTDYSEVEPVKLSILEKLWRHFQKNHLDPETERGQQFREFQQNGGEELWAWSVYVSLSDHFKETIQTHGWKNWTPPYRDPYSQEVRNFADQHADQIAFHQYLQWQAELQLQAIGRRSMELGLKVGLIGTIAESVSQEGFETWYRQVLYAQNMRILKDSNNGMISSMTGCIPYLPAQMRSMAYEPFIVMLRANMKYTGGVRINTQSFQEHQNWLPLNCPNCNTIMIRFPVEEMLAVLALESQRNRCMVICENAEKLSENVLSTLLSKQFYISQIGRFTINEEKGWLAPADYPQQSVVAAGNDRSTLDDFWLGKDIELRAESYSDRQTYQREQKIIARAADRAQLLVALQREKLLPEGYDVDPVSVPVMTPALIRAVHLFLVKSAARIFLLQLENIPFPQHEVITEHDESKLYQNQKLTNDLEKILADDTLSHLLEAFCDIRGIGVMKPSPLLSSRQEEKTVTIPGSTYRLQLNANFPFKSVTDVVPYLKELGISHCYTSPYLQARPGSSHGYDIIDHSAINTEFGSREDYEEFIAALGQYEMAQLVDMVPNHMGVGSDNRWWMDVLENGQFSLYADFFDINWQPLLEELHGRILLPVLGNYYGTELENDRLRLEFISDQGVFYIVYYDQRFPVAPTTYPFILKHDLQRLESILGTKHDGILELHNLITSFDNLGRDQETDVNQLQMRHRNKEALKRLLAKLCQEVHEVSSFIKENVILFNGRKNHAESFDLLHELLSRQIYRLAFWRVASDEINYRRFFDINDLAGIRMEEPRVFEETHRLILDLISTGKIDGLRIDHPDGLFDPGQYFQRLQNAIRGSSESVAAQIDVLPFYIVVEKILADFEHLQTDWQVHGTTGYDFAAQVNGLFIDSSSEKLLTTIYHRFIGESIDPDYQIYRCKKLIIKTAMAGELNVLAGELHKLAKMNRHTQDFTLNSLREALIEIIALLPVYRTYIISDRIEKSDLNYIEWAIAEARKKQQAENTLIYDFIKTTLLLEPISDKNTPNFEESLNFVMKLQQYTGPVMAKGVEDTFFYIYNRLLSLNEVGGDPRRYGLSVAAFHHANSERQKYWPYSMLNTSTHDSKRSEDVRARINVISEIPGEWQNAIRNWSKINRGHKTKIDGKPAPSKNDEYAFYQNLLGVWPLHVPDQSGQEDLIDRITAAMLKAVREAKIHTSWTNQNHDYESAMKSFVRGVLNDDRNFLSEFLPFHSKISWFGLLNGLSQLLLKLTSPGVPDIYQGNEIWHFRLVDPDNRQPIDFDHRKKLQQEMHNFFSEYGNTCAAYVPRILEDISDGRIKLYTTWRTLSYRQRYPDLFEQGNYLPLHTHGRKKDNLCAFMRSRAGKTLIVATPRLCAGLLTQQKGQLPCGKEVWLDTELILPGNTPLHFKNLFTDELISADNDPAPTLSVARIFSSFPVALLENISQGGDNEREN